MVFRAACLYFQLEFYHWFYPICTSWSFITCFIPIVLLACYISPLLICLLINSFPPGFVATDGLSGEDLL